MNRYFITGTDTDCGKTYVTSQLIAACRDAVAIKPVASGCVLIDGQLVSPDAQQLQKHSNLSLDLINPWRFAAPVSPHLAAQTAGITLTVEKLLDYCLNLAFAEVKTLFIEGAGGLIVPLNDKETWLDFLQCAKIPVILVVGMKLGCINHALLTASALQTNNIKCCGWIANFLDPDMLMMEENADTLCRLLPFPLLARVPYLGALESIEPGFFYSI